MASRRLLAIVAFAACIYAAAAINGGINCKYFSNPTIIRTMQANGSTPDQIAAAINSTRYVNGYLCKSCVATRMQIQNVGLVQAGYGECWCAPNYGWSQKIVTNSNRPGFPTYYNKYLCTKCPTSTTYNYTGTSTPNTGPYRPLPLSLPAGTSLRWVQTGCTRGQPSKAAIEEALPAAPKATPKAAAAMAKSDKPAAAKINTPK